MGILAGSHRLLVDRLLDRTGFVQIYTMGRDALMCASRKLIIHHCALLLQGSCTALPQGVQQQPQQPNQCSCSLQEDAYAAQSRDAAAR